MLCLCQVVMAVFSYLYLNSWAARHSVTVGYVLSKALQLEPDQMLDFFAKARRLSDLSCCEQVCCTCASRAVSRMVSLKTRLSYACLATDASAPDARPDA